MPFKKYFKSLTNKASPVPEEIKKYLLSDHKKMSASPMARAVTSGQDIPTRRVVINNEEDMPSDYSTTPGGTIFGTTPGGTKIVYERAFLINMRNSPLARTPPKNLPSIPGWCW